MSYRVDANEQEREQDDTARQTPDSWGALTLSTW
jgi:hypothetical protein